MGVSQSDVSCVSDRIHSDVSEKMYHIVKDNFVNLLHNLKLKHNFTVMNVQ